MNSAICTLFESHYHYGVGALANSLYKNGYRGCIYAGFRGLLPYWASTSKSNSFILWPGARTLDVAEGLQLHFLPLQTNYHLTNYKPDFMLRLCEGPAKEASSIFYFDPDIVVTAPWTFFDDWVSCGVALCEDVNSPLTQYHPRRVAWRRYFGDRGVPLSFKNSIYANGGFVGVSKEDCSFLVIWKKIQELMASEIGGLDRSSLTGKPLPENLTGPFAPFGKTDQDALNAGVEAWEGNISFAGQEGMGFKYGTLIMPHALGSPKPWNKKFVWSALNGIAPSIAEKAFWSNTESPIHTYDEAYTFLKRKSILLASFISRFYKRS